MSRAPTYVPGGNAQWELLDFSSIQIGFDTQTTRFHYHEGLPLVTIVCKTCGHLVNFAAAAVGLKPADPPVAGS